jgi:effector-binding domain-containing protein
MIDTPCIIHSSAQLAAVIHLRIPRAEMMHVFRPAVDELLAVLTAQGIKPVGAVFAHHLQMSPDTFDFEVGLPVGTPVIAAGRVRPGELPAAKVVRTIYHGAYEGLYAAWAELMGWLEANGHVPGPDLWECYVAGPHSSPDPADWHTELNRPVLD